MSAIIIDTETTGFDNPEVIELAYVNYPEDEGDCGFRARFKPSRPIEWGALATHHILPEDLVDCPASEGAFARVPEVDYFIGHGVDFDWGILGRPQVKRICTLAMARNLWPEVDSHSLSAMTYFISEDKSAARERLRNAHSALADVLLCADLLKVICAVAKILPDDLERLYAFSEDSRIPRIMTFGKYKGEPVSSVDRGWYNWYRRQSDTDPYLLEAFRRLGY